MSRRLAIALLVTSLAAPVAAKAAGATGPVEAGAFEHGIREQKKIALTFDACTTRDPNPYDPRITAVLDEMHVPATIFVGGGWAVEEASALVALARDPLFEIGNHTFTHPHLTRLSEEQIRQELLRTEAAIAALTGRAPTLFRPPYGEYDGRVLHVAVELGLTTVEYDLPSGDPGKGVSAHALVSWVLRGARPGSIVVMHINHRGFATADALPAIVAGLRARGFELVKVSDLLHVSAKPTDAVAAGTSARPSSPHA